MQPLLLIAIGYNMLFAGLYAFVNNVLWKFNFLDQYDVKEATYHGNKHHRTWVIVWVIVYLIYLFIDAGLRGVFD